MCEKTLITEHYDGCTSECDVDKEHLMLCETANPTGIKCENPLVIDTGVQQSNHQCPAHGKKIYANRFLYEEEEDA
ncbi:MAG: hypothetical protein M4579_000219 [Chaenotheca gracillima]|nr:MAG: hypothetical protein M4579_000219 [Chaenotheca gracillima]